MVYFYAALGVVMMTGIMAVFEMGVSLTGQSLLPSPSDIYFDSSQGENCLDGKCLDEELLTILVNPDDVARGLSGQALCNALNQADPGQYSFGLIKNRKSPWDEGCLFEMSYKELNKNVSHKILIKPPAQGVASLLPYELFSCTSARDGYQCSFERNEGG